MATSLPYSPPAPLQADMLEREVAALRRQLSERSDLMAMVAHELRNPLHVLSLQVSVARLTAETHGQVDTVTRLAKAQSTLERYVARVTVLLDLATREGRDYPASLQAVDLQGVVAGVVDALAPEAQYFGVQVEQDVPVVCPAVVDPMVVEQIVENLLLNAFKHAACTRVRIALRGADGWAELDIADNGRGIEEADQARIFKKFGVAESLGRGTGSGLGLWIVRRLSQVLSGSVSLVSAPGQGCTFQLRFPLFQTVQEAT